MKVPLSSPDVIEKDIEAVVKVIKTRHLSIGPKVVEFEKRIKEYVWINYIVEINNNKIAYFINRKYYLVKYYAY